MLSSQTNQVYRRSVVKFVQTYSRTVISFDQMHQVYSISITASTDFQNFCRFPDVAW